MKKITLNAKHLRRAVKEYLERRHPRRKVRGVFLDAEWRTVLCRPDGLVQKQYLFAKAKLKKRRP